MSTSLVLLVLMLATAEVDGSLDSLHAAEHGKRADVTNMNVLQSIKTEPHYCFERKCWCVGTFANCSGNHGALTFVPKFQERITALDFSSNALQFIPGDFFANVTDLTWLDMSSNLLYHISDDAFRPLNQLKRITLDRNFNLSFEFFWPLSKVKALEEVNATDCAHGSLPSDLFSMYPLPNLKALRMDRNEMTVLNFTVFQPLKQLQVLSLSRNRISSSVSTDHTSQIDTLDLNRNGLWEFLVTCSNIHQTFYPQLKHLHFSSNQVMHIPEEICLPLLETLDLSENAFPFFTDAFGLDRFPRLQSLQLYNMRRSEGNLPAYTFNNSNLRFLSLEHNDLDFSTERVSPDALAGCPNLEQLDLSNNRFLGVSDDKLVQLFSTLPRLTHLVLGSDLLREIPIATFRYLPALKVLNLFTNRLTTIPDGAFDLLTNLTELMLSGNQLSVIGPKTFSPHLRHNLDRLDLGENPFHCSCDLLWFQEWLLSNPKLFSNPRMQYKHLMCKNLPGVKVADFSINEQTCLMSKEASISIIISFAMVICAFTVTVVLFRYRWHIRLMLYESFRGRQERLSRLQNEHFLYDVFVSYASEDLPWVCRHLVPGLETYLGLRLCLHERDFIPGRQIVDNIADSVNASKKVVMLFSVDFARSSWCQFELMYCLRYALDNNDDLIVVCLHDIQSHEMTTAMRAVFKTTTYIQWCEEEDAVKSFWGRLQAALQEVMPQND